MRPEQMRSLRALSDEEKIAKLLLDGDRERMIPLVESAKDRVGADKIVIIEILN